MKERLRSIAGRVVYERWPLRSAMHRVRPRAGLLVYHRVADVGFDPYGLAVATDVFEQQLRILRQHYHVEALDTFLEQLPHRAYQDRTIIVTFDDGYVDNLTAAYPIAARHGVPIAVFITVAPVLEGAPFWWDELGGLLLQPPISPRRRAVHDRLHTMLKQMPGDRRNRFMDAIRASMAAPMRRPDGGRPMTPAELQHFDSLPGVTIGAHTVTHAALGALPTRDQARELVDSKARLETLLAHPVTLLAYPFGKSPDLSRQTPALAADAGYTAAFTTMGRPVVPSTARYTIPRLTVHDWPGETFLRRLRALFQEATP